MYRLHIRRYRNLGVSLNCQSGYLENSIQLSVGTYELGLQLAQSRAKLWTEARRSANIWPGDENLDYSSRLPPLLPPSRSRPVHAAARLPLTPAHALQKSPPRPAAQQFRAAPPPQCRAAPLPLVYNITS